MDQVDPAGAVKLATTALSSSIKEYLAAHKQVPKLKSNTDNRPTTHKDILLQRDKR